MYLRDGNPISFVFPVLVQTAVIAFDLALIYRAVKMRQAPNSVRSIPLSKIKLAIVLPLVQVVVTAILTWWSDRVSWMTLGGGRRVPGRYAVIHLFVLALREMWTGVNAPTYPLALLFGIETGKFLHLCAVAVLWYLVGAYLQRSSGAGIPEKKSRKLVRTGGTILVAVWGMILLGVSVSMIDDSLHMVQGWTKWESFIFMIRLRLEQSLALGLFLLWSVILIGMPTAKLVRFFRRGHPDAKSQTSRGSQSELTI